MFTMHVTGRVLAFVISSAASVAALLFLMSPTAAWAALYGPFQAEPGLFYSSQGTNPGLSYWCDAETSQNGLTDAHGDVSTGSSWTYSVKLCANTGQASNSVRIAVNGSETALPDGTPWVTDNYYYRTDKGNSGLPNADVNGDGTVYFWVRARVVQAGSCAKLRVAIRNTDGTNYRVGTATIAYQSSDADSRSEYGDYALIGADGVGVSRQVSTTDLLLRVWRVSDSACTGNVLIDRWGHKDYYR